MSQCLKSGSLIGKACTYNAIWSPSTLVVALDSIDFSVKVGQRHGCVLCCSAAACKRSFRSYPLLSWRSQGNDFPHDCPNRAWVKPFGGISENIGTGSGGTGSVEWVHATQLLSQLYPPLSSLCGLLVARVCKGAGACWACAEERLQKLTNQYIFAWLCSWIRYQQEIWCTGPFCQVCKRALARCEIEHNDKEWQAVGIWEHLDKTNVWPSADSHVIHVAFQTQTVLQTKQEQITMKSGVTGGLTSNSLEIIKSSQAVGSVRWFLLVQGTASQVAAGKKSKMQAEKIEVSAIHSIYIHT